MCNIQSLRALKRVSLGIALPCGVGFYRYQLQWSVYIPTYGRREYCRFNYVLPRDSDHSKHDVSCTERSEPSSRTTLIGEQPNLWELLHPQDVVSRHRGAELRRRYELLGGTSLLSLE